LQEIVAGIWCWQHRPRGLRPGQFGTRTSYAMIANGQTLLVDPLVDGGDDPVLGALDDLTGGRVHILISKPFHTRSAELLWRRYRRAPTHAWHVRAMSVTTFPPIGDYAFLSNCEQNCLVAPDGAVEWMCLPRPDSPSVFGALLDRTAGASGSARPA
jgi:Trehalase-like, N-terminal